MVWMCESECTGGKTPLRWSVGVLMGDQRGKIELDVVKEEDDGLWFHKEGAAKPG